MTSRAAQKNMFFDILDFFDIFDFSLWGEERAKKIFLMFLTFWIFLTFLTFHFGAGNQALEARGTRGGAGSSGNPGRGQAGSAYRLLWNPVRTPLGKPNWGKILCKMSHLYRPDIGKWRFCSDSFYVYFFMSICFFPN